MHSGKDPRPSGPRRCWFSVRPFHRKPLDSVRSLPRSDVVLQGAGDDMDDLALPLQLAKDAQESRTQQRLPLPVAEVAPDHRVRMPPREISSSRSSIFFGSPWARTSQGVSQPK